MKNHSLITNKEINILFNKGFQRICRFDRYTQEECINLGYIRPIELGLPIVKFMNEWVEAIEKKLSTLEKYTEEYADWLSIRAFTFDEFRWVLKTSFNEDKLDRVLAYSFLYIDDPIELESFKIKYGREDEDIRSSFLRALTDITKIEFPQLHKFLCEESITLRYPISAFVKHTYLLAQSSSGKSEFIKHIINELTKNVTTKSIILLEPHLDLSIEVLQLRSLWKQGLDKVIYLDPDIANTSFGLTKTDSKKNLSFSINPFDALNVESSSINFLVEHLSKAFFGIINSEETFQMEALIEACIETLLLRDNSDIRDLKRFMDDSQNEDLVNFGIENLIGERLNLMSYRFRQDPKIQQTKSSIYYRLQSILGKAELVNCLIGKRTVNIEKAINEGMTIICNFSKARLGADSAKMLGKLFMALVSGYATLRQFQSKEERMATFAFLDEFQNYVNPNSTEEMFAEQRKYQLFFFASNQQMGQSMSGETKRIVSGNTALKLMGENESDSIEWLSKQFKKLPMDALFKLPKYSFWFYDKYNKDLGSFILRVPSHLVESKNAQYLRIEELKRVFEYLIKESGIYHNEVDCNRVVNDHQGGSKDQILKHSFTN